MCMSHFDTLIFYDMWGMNIIHIALFIILRDTIFTTFFLLRYKHLFSFKCKAVMLYAGFWYSAVYQFGVIVLVVNLA